MRIGILMTGHAIPQVQETLGDYDAMFVRLLDGHGFDFVTYNVVDQEYPDSPQACDAWLITGSKHGAYEDHPWIPPLEQFIRDVHAANRPMLGICFGHQIIAQALGGKVEKFSGGWSIGATSYQVDGQPVTLNAWHQDQVTELPSGASVVGSSDFCAYAALRYGDRIYTIQAHPEFGADMIGILLDHRAPGVVPDSQIEAARAALATPDNNTIIADRMAQFIKRGV